MYCNFEYTGNTFNNKRVYRCKECGITLGLDDANIQILCFKQQQKIAESTFQQMTQQSISSIDVAADVDMVKIAQSELIRKSKQKEDEDNPENLCSKTEIDQRLAVCNNCEHFKENTCMLCGCRVVREANYQNKLAHKNASCPINKWGQIAS